jgi:ketosteroid isomerase-like protein
VTGHQRSQNLEVISRGLAAFAERDVERWLDCFDPAVEVLEDPSIPDAGRYDGHDGLRRWMHVMDRNWENFSVDGERFIERDEDVAVLHRVYGRGRSSGVAIEGQFGSVFTLSEARVVRWVIFSSWSQTLAAIGFAEGTVG